MGALLVVGLLAGCSGASDDTSTKSGGGADGWSGRTNIEAIFESYCSGCHGTQWSTCWNVQESASLVDEMVSSGAMPRVGMLTTSDKTTLVDWLGQGAPCSGTRPSGDDAGMGMIPLPPTGPAEAPGSP
jgi:hypothetical protein